MARLATKCCPVVGDGEALRFGKEADCNPDVQCAKSKEHGNEDDKNLALLASTGSEGMNGLDASTRSNGRRRCHLPSGRATLTGRYRVQLGQDDAFSSRMRVRARAGERESVGSDPEFCDLSGRIERAEEGRGTCSLVLAEGRTDSDTCSAWASRAICRLA